jgi:putative ABC transport system permease protein
VTGILQAVRMAFSAIRDNKMRSFLTMLGVIIGVLAVTTLVSIGQSAMGSVTSQIESLGTNRITVSIQSDHKVSLKLDELTALQGTGGVKYVSPVLTAGQTAKAGANTHDTTVYGVTEHYAEIADYTVQSGRFLAQNDGKNRSAVCVVGVDVADELFGQRNVVGESVQISGKRFEIVGVLSEQGESMGRSQDDVILIPFTLAQRMFEDTAITSFNASAVSAADEDINQAMATVTDFVAKKTRTSDDYNVFSQSQLLDVMGSVTNTLTLMLAGIAGISLLVGGIGIMNIMLVSVSERTREIGIRKAIGAQKSDIMLQFMAEAVAISLVGGVIGLALGYGLLQLVGGLMGMAMTMSVTVAGTALGFSILVGVLFGSYPANKASNLLPIEALRYE